VNGGVGSIWGLTIGSPREGASDCGMEFRTSAVEVARNFRHVE